MASSNGCTYRFGLLERQGANCPNAQYENSEFCVLHIPLPGKDDPSQEPIRSAKKDKQHEKIRASDFDFEGAQLVEFCVAEGTEISEPIFYGATFNDEASFDGVTFNGEVIFCRATFRGEAWFRETTFKGSVSFDEARFDDEASFRGTKFRDKTWFDGVTFTDEALFDNVVFSGAASFLEAKFVGGSSFRGTVFGHDVEFRGTTFAQELHALDTQFSHPRSQEQLCRAAKRSCESRGDKDEADRYHYREMEAKRKQKGKLGYLEKVPFQWVLGYGVKPLRTFGIWLIVIGVFALYYWLVQALHEVSSPLAYLYFSIMTAITPGYGGFNIMPETYLPASIEAVFGAFMWVAFIAVLTRKYFRS
ncbi:MAG: pentapeptide repeat-containing protein [Halobacteriota archaeon]